MLDTATSKKIISFVHIKPRTIQEIAHHIHRNWRTANSYVEKIEAEQGILGLRTFRGGTRGALKIVYFKDVNNPSSSAFQGKLLREIEAGRNKYDFSPFDIYQYVDDEKRLAFLERQTKYTITDKQNLVGLLRSAEKEIIMFSGDLSWAQVKQKHIKLIDVLQEMVAKGITIKILCRVDVESINNIRKTLSLNEASAKEGIEIRHAQQPLRAFIIDNKVVRFKEQREGNTYIFYEINDQEWIEWVQKVFWKLFHSSIRAEKRIEDIESIEEMD